MGQVTEDEFKLSLELSIGGCYANSGNDREKGTANENINRHISGSGFCKNERKREIQESAGMDGEQRKKTQERDGIPKRKKIEGEKLNTSMFGENNVCACPWVAPRHCVGERDGNSSGDDIAAARSTCTSHRGRSSDSGSQSSTHTQQQQQISSASDYNYKVVADASSTIQIPNTTKTTTPPMPCVSATGPNAKTITGFLCKYTKSEVTIMCGCHGSFFSPAQFLQHAGAVDVTHPLRHITVLPSFLKP